MDTEKDLIIDLIANKGQFEKAVSEADKKLNDFSKKAQQNKAIKLKFDIANLQSDLTVARKELSSFKKYSDKDRKIKIEANHTKLKQDLQVAQNRLAEFKKNNEQAGIIQMTAKVTNLKRKVGEAENEVDKLKVYGDKKAQINAQLKVNDLQKSVSTAKKELRSIETEGKKSFFKLNKIATDFFKGLGVYFVANKIKDFFTSITNASIEFDHAFTGVRKTVNATEAEFESLKKEIRKTAKEIPVSVENLSQITQLGGQLGIAKENLIDFTKTIAAISVSSNLTSDEAATAFARIANVMKTPQEKIENMASSVVSLGNNFATTEREIVDFSQRIAGAGKIAGLSEADILGISAAFSSVGIEAEAGGTATQKSLLKINDAVNLGGDSLQKFADLTGKSAEQFAKDWKENAGQAFTEFINSLGNAGDDASKILGDLIGQDVRLQRAFLSLANAGDLVNKTIQNSNQAFAENTALQKEANIYYEDQKNKLQKLKNRWNDIGIAFGEKVLPALVSIGTFFTELGEAIVMGAEKFKTYATVIKKLGIAFISYLGARTIGVVLSGLSSITKGFIGVVNSAKNAASSVRGFAKIGAFLKSIISPVTLLTGSVTYLIYKWIDAKRKAFELSEAAKSLKKSLEEVATTKTQLKFVEEFDRLIDKITEVKPYIGKFFVDLFGSSDLTGEAIPALQELRYEFIKFNEGLGVSREKMIEFFNSLDFVKNRSKPTKEELEKIKDVLEENSLGFKKTAETIEKTTRAMSADGKILAENFQKTFKSMAEGGEEMEEALIKTFIKTIAESEDAGAAFAFAFANGVSKNDAIYQVEKAGLKVTNAFLATQIKQAVKAKDAGKIQGLLFASGIEISKSEIEGNWENIMNFLINRIEQKIPEFVMKGAEITESVSRGILANSSAIGRAMDAVLGGVEKYTGKDVFGNVFGGLFKQTGKVAMSGSINDVNNLLIELKKTTEEIKEVEIGSESFSGLSSDASGAVDAVKEINDELKEYENRVEEASSATSSFAEKTRQLYGEIEENILKARDAQGELTRELEDFKIEQTGDFLEDTAKRDIELKEEQIKLQDSLNEALESEKEVLEKIDEIRQGFEDTKTKELSQANEGDIKKMEKLKKLQEELRILEIKKSEITEKTKQSTSESLNLQIQSKKLEIDNLKSESGNIFDIKTKELEIEKAINEQLKEKQKINEKIAEIQKQKSEVETEQKQISAFIDNTGAEDQINKIQEQWEKTQFEQRKAAYENAIAQKEQEIKAEIDKQQKIIEIQSKSLEIFTSESRKAIVARAKLTNIAKDGILENEKELNEVLAEFGLENLSNEEKLILLKQNAQFAALNEEEKQVSAQQRRIFEEKEKYFKMARDVHSAMTNEMIGKTNSLISKMKTAQSEIEKVQDAMESQSSSNSSIVNNNTTKNLSINNQNTFNSEIDTESIFRRLLKKVDF